MAVTNPWETIPWDRVRRAGSKLTTPLHPDDYLRLLNPLWSERELRGRIEKVVPETDDAATLVIRPGWGWRYDHRPGQYVGIGVQVDGKFQWRSYSVSSPPQRRGRTISITVRAMPEGLLSSHLVKGLAPGTIVRLALPEGDFVLPDPPPAKMLFLVGGSGITPVMAMLRTLDRRSRGDSRAMPDVVMHYSSPTPDRMIFRDELADLEARHDSLTVHRLHTDIDGVLELADASKGLDRICPDWRERETWACGPGPMLDAISEHFEGEGARGPAPPRTLLPRARRRRRRGRHDHVPQLEQEDRRRRRHHRARGGRGGGRRHAVRLPDGHLPHLHAHPRLRHGARPAQRR